MPSIVLSSSELPWWVASGGSGRGWAWEAGSRLQQALPFSPYSVGFICKMGMLTTSRRPLRILRLGVVHCLSELAVTAARASGIESGLAATDRLSPLWSPPGHVRELRL